MKDFERDYLLVLSSNHKETLEGLRKGKLDPEQTDVLKKVAKETALGYTI
jgi:F-type H+-transporting ATPase subunit alpha